jgi:ADP-heptose:LPS heptosyltransferase
MFLNYLNIQFANIFIRPLKRKEAEKLKDEIKKGTIKRVLINRQDLIGDAVISLKIIDKLKSYFDEVYVLVSDNNSFIFDELSGVKKVNLNEVIDSNIEFDLIIDLIGTLATDKKIKSRYKIGMNRGIFSIFYSNFYLWNLTESKMQVLEFYKELIKYTLGIQLEIDDLPPSDFKKEKKDQIFILVGNKPNRNLPYEKWKELILLSASKTKTIVADDSDQRIMNKLSQEKDIKKNKNIELMVEPKQLKDLAKLANDSKLFIALDGGAEHYLERYTNSITIYTCIDQTGWHPYTLKEWNYFIIDDHVLGRSETSAGLKKYVFYKLKDRKPCYDLVCDYKKFKEINFVLLKNLFSI